MIGPGIKTGKAQGGGIQRQRLGWDSAMARPPLLDDPERAERITATVCEALRKGASMSAAATQAGIGDTTLYEWTQRGRDDLEAGRDTIWAEFTAAVTRARLDAELAALALVQAAATGRGWTERTTETSTGPDGASERVVVRERRDWRAAAWWLERSFPSRWGQQAHVTHEVRTKTWNVPGLVLPTSPEQLDQVRELVDGDGGRGQPDPEPQAEREGAEGDGGEG